MTQKSKEALKESKETRETCRNAILRMLRGGPMRTDELIKALPSFKTSTVTARISEINDEGLIEAGIEYANETSYTLYSLTLSADREKVMKEREDLHYKEWLNKASRFAHRIPTEVIRWIELEAK